VDRSSAAQILSALAPPWSERIALSASLSAGQFSGLPGVELVPLDSVSAIGGEAVDALLLAPADAPADPRGLISILDRLAPGGRAILADAPASLRGVLRAPDSLGLQIHTRGSAARLAGTGVRGQLIVLARPIPAAVRERRGDRRRLSVLLPAPERFATGTEGAYRLAQWSDFFLNEGLSDQCELIVVTEAAGAELQGLQDPLQRLHRTGALQFRRHWRPQGVAATARTALAFARGDALILDESGALPCEEAFALLDRLWREAAAAGEDGLLSVRGRSVRSHATSGKRKGAPRPVKLLTTTAAGARKLFQKSRARGDQYFSEWLSILSGGRGRVYETFVREASS